MGVALRLRGEVPASGIAAVILRHFGRHVGSSRGAGPGVDLTRNAYGTAIGRRCDGEDRPMSPRDDNGCSLRHTLHTVFDEWEQWEGPPARGRRRRSAIGSLLETWIHSQMDGG